MKKITRQHRILIALLAIAVVSTAALLAANYSKFFYKADTGGAATISMSGGSTYQIGQEYTVSANIDTGGNYVTAVHVSFNYPADLLQFESVTRGSDWSMDLDSGTSSGTVDWSVASTKETVIDGVTYNGLNGSYAVYTAKFKALASGQGTFDVTKGEVADGNNQPVTSSLSGASFTVAATPSPNPDQPDTTAPTAPSNLRSTGKSTSTVSLAWNASTDNIKVAGYTVYRNSTAVASKVTALKYTDSGLAKNTNYTYKVVANDAANNHSADSNVITVTTSATGGSTTTPPDTTPQTQATVSPPVFVSISFASDSILDSTQKRTKGITFTGTSDPSSTINLTINSDPISGSATSDSTGKWSYTLDQWLPDGQHSVDATAQKDSLTSTATTTHFVVDSSNKSQIAFGSTLPGSTPVVQTPTTSSKGLFSSNIILFGSIGVGIVVIAIIILIIVSSIRKKKKAFEFEKINFRENNDNILINKPDESGNSSQPVDNSLNTPTAEALPQENPEIPQTAEETQSIAQPTQPATEKAFPENSVDPLPTTAENISGAVAPEKVEVVPENTSLQTPPENIANNNLSGNSAEPKPTESDVAVDTKAQETQAVGSITIDNVEEVPQNPIPANAGSGSVPLQQQAPETKTENKKDADNGNGIEYGFSHNTTPTPNNFYKPFDHSNDDGSKKV